jgi:hypothetical protein
MTESEERRFFIYTKTTAFVASFNDRLLVQQFIYFFRKEMSRDTIIRWRLINENLTQRKKYKEGNGQYTESREGKIDRDKIPGREQNKSALRSLLKSSVM